MFLTCLLSGKKITLKDIHNIASNMKGRNDLQDIAESLAEVAGTCASFRLCNSHFCFISLRLCGF